jgi:type II secretion system protein N
MSLSSLLHSALASLRSLRSSWLTDLGTKALTLLERLHTRLPALSSCTGWLFYTLVCFVLFLLLTFPSDLLLRRVVASVARNAKVQVRYAEGDWTWGRGWVLRDLTLVNSATGLPSLQLARLTVRPSLVGLVYGQPLPLTFSANLYGGTVDGTVQQEANGFAVRFNLCRLALEQWPLPAPWGQGRVAGNLTANGTLQGNLAHLASLQGTLALTLSDGAVRAGTIAWLPLPALQAVQAHVRATLTGGRLEIAELKLSADGVEAQMQGGIALRTPLLWSVLDLQLTTRVTGTLPPALASLVSLLPPVPGTAGERQASITGTLAIPAVQ